MWWIIGIICFVVWLLFFWSKIKRAKEFSLDYIPERVATEFIKRRSSGESMDQIRDSLYREFSLEEWPLPRIDGRALDFHPIPFSDLRLAGYVKEMPADALRLGEIAYTILYRTGIYPLPRDNQWPRDSAYQYDAMARIGRKCIVHMVVFEVSGNKIDPCLKEMMKKWSALESEISIVNAQLEAAIRKPPRPEMRDKTEGIPTSEGLFGAKWLMPMEHVLQIAPQPVPFFQIKSDNFCHFGKYNGQQASFSYYFENNQLTEIWVCVNKSSEKKFRRMQSHLSTDFGPMSAPCPSKDYKLLSKGDFNKLVIEHWLNDDERVGLTEMIKFRSTAKSS
jgi:hypothetical protein